MKRQSRKMFNKIILGISLIPLHSLHQATASH